MIAHLLFCTCSFDVDYDGIGRVFELEHVGINRTSFEYNPASQLSARTVTSVDFQVTIPVIGTESYTPNTLNQYTQVGSQSLGYDLNGNLTSYDGWSYAYDAYNRLKTANKTGTSLGLTYDPTGRLAETDHNGTVTEFLYDGDELVAEYDATGTLLYRYVHGIGNDDPQLQYTGSGTTNKRYLITDERGSVIVEADGTGTTQAIHRYGPFGEPMNTSASRFRYTGQIILPGTDLYHYKARVYHPELGRFLQTDPIGYADQMNLYAYASNDPANFVDPTGMANCPADDPNCVETPESAEKPGDPDPQSEQVTQMEEVVVTGHRTNTGSFLNFSDGAEHAFLVGGDGMTPAPIRSLGSVYCGRGMSVEPHAVAAPPGSTIAHTHPDSYGDSGSVPGPGDNRAAHNSSAGVAFTMTSANVFTIEAMFNGTYRTTVASGPALSASQRSALTANMQKWENPPKGGKKRSKRSTYCPK